VDVLDLVWLIPALPLAGAVVLLAAGRRLGEPLAGWIATAACAGSFAAGVAVYLDLLSRDEHDRQHVQTLFEWIPVGDLSVDVGFLADPLSMTMVLFVTGISALIHLYSVGYMHGDPDYGRFFLYLNLFVTAMLVLVLGDNLLLTFLGWEGVGACSYLLISFWYEKTPNAVAGKKAFVTNRIGDWGYMIGMFLAFTSLGTLTYVADDGTGLLQAAGSLPAITATGIAVMLFVGAVGKSAQLPLHVWLPDAMAGPTPVSALIHAATMVTSGVYLMTRVAPIIGQADAWVPDLIAWVGAATALFAATIAVSQRDIKKVLAYSTVSQLGYMFLAVGTGAYVAAVFHMVTHAFFKALLFLGSGSVIHGMHEEQDMRYMGALRRFMPVTGATFIVGWLAIAGVPPFAGFWSKDEILLFAWASSPALWLVGLVTALLTAFYMSRQVFMVFFGEARWNEARPTAQTAEDTATATSGADEEHVGSGVVGGGDAPTHGPEPHESPWTMTAPLVVLALLSITGGGLNLPLHGDIHFLADWLHPVVEEWEAHIEVATGTKVVLAVAATVTALLGIALGAAVYLRRRIRPVEPDLLLRGYRYDEALASLFGGPGTRGAELLGTADSRGIDGAVTGVATLVNRGGGRLRVVQTGFVRNYALAIAAGSLLVLGWFLLRAGV
jgi:NADH-quinone oxidoreductase subunit L